MAPSTKSILVMGIKQDNSPGQQFSTPEAQKRVQEEFARAKDAGYDLTVYRVDVVDSRGVLEEVQGLLRTKVWDGVLVGFGIRGDASHSLLFTDLINTVVREVSPPPKFMFALRPDDLVEVMDRELRSK